MKNIKIFSGIIMAIGAIGMFCLTGCSQNSDIENSQVTTTTESVSSNTTEKTTTTTTTGTTITESGTNDVHTGYFTLIIDKTTTPTSTSTVAATSKNTIDNTATNTTINTTTTNTTTTDVKTTTVESTTDTTTTNTTTEVKTTTPVSSTTTVIDTTSPSMTTLSEVSITEKQTETTNSSEKTVESTIGTTTVEATTLEEVTTTTEEEYVIYKPLTHYIHRSTCHWAKVDYVYRIESTEGIVARRCSECNPDMEILNYYQEDTTTSTTETSGDSSSTTTVTTTTTNMNTTTTTDTTTTTTSEEFNPEDYGITQEDVILLRKIVSSEYGADWVSVEEKAKIVASVMNQVYDPRYPNTVRGALDASCTPWGFYPDKDYYMSDSIIAAVEYYFKNKDTVFADWKCNSWWGDGRRNHFYFQ